MKRFAYANWKMSQTRAGLDAFVTHFTAKTAGVELAIFPTFVQLPEAIQKISLTQKAWLFGGQDCSSEKDGAFTGEVSAQSLKEIGCQTVLIGHSERRQRANETNESLRKKIDRALEAKLKPVFCIGETESERNAGKTLDVLKHQLKAIDGITATLVIAYEPVWAIGTGKVPTLQEVEDAHAFVWKLAPKVEGVLYGGSVKPENSQQLGSVNGVSGFLVGGASLNGENFSKIVESVL